MLQQIRPKMFVITHALALLVSITVMNSVMAGKPMNVQVTLRGKKYDVSDVSSVKELQQSVEGLTGLTPAKQSLLFDGKKLRAEDGLEESGVAEGSVINVVPTKKKTSSSSSSGTRASSAASVETSVNGDTSSTDGGGSGASQRSAAMDNLMQQAGVDQDKIKELMQSMGMSGEGGGGMPDLAESLKMMKDMVNNPLFQQYMTDPERLEQSRQMILNNPMMKAMMKDVPGFEEILEDKEKWRETMLAAANMYKDMGPEMMESMMSGLAGGLGGGLNNPPGGDSGLSTAALDELSEGD